MTHENAAVDTVYLSYWFSVHDISITGLAYIQCGLSNTVIESSLLQNPKMKLREYLDHGALGDHAPQAVELANGVAVACARTALNAWTYCFPSITVLVEKIRVLTKRKSQSIPVRILRNRHYIGWSYSRIWVTMIYISQLNWIRRFLYETEGPPD